jgi:hypothetical protein
LITVIIPTFKGSIGAPFLSLGTIGIEYVFVVRGLLFGRFDFVVVEGAEVGVGGGPPKDGEGGMPDGEGGMGEDGMCNEGDGGIEVDEEGTGREEDEPEGVEGEAAGVCICICICVFPTPGTPGNLAPPTPALNGVIGLPGILV